MHIQVLYFEGCPNHAPTVSLVREVITQLGLTTNIEEVEVTGPNDAERQRFLGSPTVRVNGVDIEPRASTRTDYGVSCRLYDGSGVPPRDLLVTACQAQRTR